MGYVQSAIEKQKKEQPDSNVTSQTIGAHVRPRCSSRDPYSPEQCRRLSHPTSGHSMSAPCDTICADLAPIVVVPIFIASVLFPSFHSASAPAQKVYSGMPVV